MASRPTVIPSTVDALEAERENLLSDMEDLCRFNYELQQQVVVYRRKYIQLRVVAALLVRRIRNNKHIQTPEHHQKERDNDAVNKHD